MSGTPSFHDLTNAQFSIWFAQSLDPESPAYNIGEYIEISESIHLELFQASLSEAVNQTDTLALKFIDSDTGPKQYLAPNLSWEMAYLDFSNQLEPAKTALAWLQEDMAVARHLSHGPLFNFALIKITTDCFFYYQRFHPIIADGFSLAIFARKVFNCYSTLLAGKTIAFQPSGSWFDVLAAEKSYFNSQRYKRDQAYWLSKLQHRPESVTLSGKQPALISPRHPLRCTSKLPYQVADALRALGKQHGASFAQVMIAAAALYLHKFTQQPDFIVGVPVANRIGAKIRTIVGMQSNILTVRFSIEKDLLFGEFLSQATKCQREAFRHQRYRIEALRNDLGLQLKEPSLYGMVINVMPDAYELSLNDRPTTHYNLSNGPEPSLSLNVYDRQKKQDLHVHINANPDHYSAEDLAIHMQRWLDFLARFAYSTADMLLSQIQLLSAAERQTLLYTWNATQTDYPKQRCIHELFEAQVAAAPDAIALVHKQQQLSYAELNSQANRLARHLRQLGVLPDGLVGICIERGLNMLIGLLGILKAGGAYVPLDPNYPRERLQFMLEDSAPLALLCDSTTQSLLAGLAADITRVNLSMQADVWAQHASANLDRHVTGLTSAHLAYVIYTSGSTGKPKGVMIRHQNTVALLSWANATIKYDINSGFLAATSISFDLSVFEFFVPLTQGGQLILVDNLLELVTNPSLHDIGLINTVPSAMLAIVDAEKIPSSTRIINLAGEPLTASLAKHIFATSSVESIYNLYGPTETTTYSTWVEIKRGENFPAHIGRPIANTQLYILDQHCQPVPIGVSGELYIGGAGVARGYLNRPELSAERFLIDPFATQADALMYKTGDLGRWLPDGNIEFIGRNDYQVKIRGFRIELGEIESVLSQCPGLSSCVVIAREAGANKRLVAYYTASEMLEADALRSYLSASLPDYMIPAAFVYLEAFPLTPNGKLDRKALPDPRDVSYAIRAYEATLGEIEQTIAAIWSNLLHIDRVGRSDNFFALGGHSLLAVQVISRVRQSLGVETKLAVLFANPVLSDFAQSLHSAEVSEFSHIQAVNRQRSLALSFAQLRLWFLAQLDTASTAYHIPSGVRLFGELNLTALRLVLAHIIQRHEALRTTFIATEGEPALRISPVDTRFQLLEQDLSDQIDPEPQLQALASLEAQQVFDLERGPLIRGRLIKLADKAYVLLITQHHIISDGWSLGLLTKELGTLYRALVAGQDNPLPPLPIQYADYAAWQRQWLTGERLQAQAGYWQTALTGAPALLELPSDHPRPAQQNYAGDHIEVQLDAELTSQLKALSLRQGATLYMTLLASWALLLARLSGQNDIVIGTPSANRGREEIELLMGFFVNTLAIRIELADELTVAELLKRVKQQTLAAQANQDIPFEQVVEILRPLRSLAYAPLFQVMFAWQNAPQDVLELPGMTVAPF
jgi:amino acid adenylation domain-containing protein